MIKKIRELVVLPALEEGANGKKLIESNHSLINYFDPNSSSKYHFIHIYYMRIQENILINMRASRPRTVHDTELDKNALLTYSFESVLQRRGERANRRAKAEKERERSHGRENRERERERERERNRDRDYHQPVNFVPARESRRESYILYDEEEEQRRQAKRKTEMAFKERDIRWQHREETWQQIVNVKQNEI
ncbi:unnamed protein product [Rhizophagus irregularis]|nr:unnamed protein product [Rhizophagus irregularis]